VTVVRTLTNVVTVTKTVVVTNAVNLVRGGSCARTPRKTAPYRVSSPNLQADQLRKLLSGAGARVLACDSGAVALVEAPDGIVSDLRTGGVVSVEELSPADKVDFGLTGGSAPQAVRIQPLSVIDVSAVAGAVRALGGELVQVVAAGRPVVRAKLSGTTIGTLAERADVRRIERDSQ